jgi:hypothetical protein
MRVATILPISVIATSSLAWARVSWLTLRAPMRAASAVVPKLLSVRWRVVALLPIAALLLAGWRDAPVPLLNEPNPADPWAPAPRVRYQSTIRSYKSRRPVEPLPWNEQNQRVAPEPKSGR